MRLDGKKALLLGGTGAIGVYVAPKLVDLGCEVYITSRKARKSAEPRIHYIKGNARDWNFLSEVLKDGYDIVVDFMIYTTNEFESRYKELLESTSHYLFLSSYRVYGDNKGLPITETSPRLLDSVDDPAYLKTDEYGLKKAREENLLMASEKKNWTILRPSVTYSKTRFQLGTMEAQDFVYRALKKKKVIFPKEMLEKEATMSWAGDVAEMIVRVILNEKAMGEVYTLATSEHHKWKEIIEYYKKILGLKVVYVDLEEYERIIGGKWQIKYDRMLDRVVDNSKILSVTGMRQEDLMSVYNGLRIELLQFVNKPDFKAINEERHALMDEITVTLQDEVVEEVSKPVSKAVSVAKKSKEVLLSDELTLSEKIDKGLKFLGINKN